jgi:hypothetical protein
MRARLLSIFLLALVIGAVPEKITVEERCFLSFEKDVAILHYNGFINCGRDEEIKASVKIPDALYKPDIYPTILGEGAMIGVPGVYDLKTQIPEAKITIRDGEASYSWDFRTEPGKTAVIGFSSYYGQRPEKGVNDLSLQQEWSTDGNRLTARITLRNAGAYPIKNLSILLRLPEKKIDFAGNRMNEKAIVDFRNVQVSEELIYQENFFDPQLMMMGISVMEKNPISLAPGESVEMTISSDYSVISEGTIEPVIGINFDQDVDEFRFGLRVEYGPSPERMDFKRSEYYQLQFRSPALTAGASGMKVNRDEI